VPRKHGVARPNRAAGSLSFFDRKPSGNPKQNKVENRAQYNYQSTGERIDEQ